MYIPLKGYQIYILLMEELLLFQQMVYLLAKHFLCKYIRIFSISIVSFSVKELISTKEAAKKFTLIGFIKI